MRWNDPPYDSFRAWFRLRTRKSTFGLQRALSPRRIAIVGASPRASSLGRIVRCNLDKAGFAGEVGIVNPNRTSIDGNAVHADLASLPFVPDLIVITAPAATIPGIIAQAGARGTAGGRGKLKARKSFRRRRQSARSRRRKRHRPSTRHSAPLARNLVLWTAATAS